MKKRLAFVLAVTLCVAVLARTAPPAVAAPSDDSIIQIYDADDLLEFASRVTKGDIKLNATLMGDMDMTGVSWKPIGSTADGYSGTFDGNNHTISNLSMRSTAQWSSLFFLNLNEDGIIKNLALTNIWFRFGVAGGYSTNLVNGQPYTIAGGEMSSKGSGMKYTTATTSKILLDGKEVIFPAYMIEGNHYFKLRDIGNVFDFGVDWDGANNTIVIDTSTGYTPE